MGKLLDRIKQGLRTIGRVQVEPAARDRSPPATRDGTHSAQRLRTELDSLRPPASPPPAAHTKPPPQTAAATRLRKAVLAKARRGALTQPAGTTWGMAPTATRGLFDDPVAQDPAPLLSGATFAVGQTGTGRPPAPIHNHSPLQGSTVFAAPSTAATDTPASSSLFDAAPLFDNPEDRKDRWF